MFNTPTVCLDSLLKVHKMQMSALHKFNRDLAKTSDLIAQTYTHQGNTTIIITIKDSKLLGQFALACKYLEQSCSSVGATYGEQSVEFANELQKLASLLFHRSVQQ